MKHIKTIILTLLVALLALPTAINAQDSNSIRILYEQNFESITNVEETGWTFAGESMSIESDAVGKYIEFSLGQSNGRSANLTWGKEIFFENGNSDKSLLIDGKYQVKYDFCIKRGSTNQYNSSMTVFTNHAPYANQPYRNPWDPEGYWQNYLFDMSQVNGESLQYAIDGGTIRTVNEDGTISYSIDYSDPSTFEEDAWYTVSLDVNVNDRTVDYCITSLDGIILKQGQLDIPQTDVNGDPISMYAEGLHMMLARFGSTYWIDNIKIYTETSEDYANVPSVELIGIGVTSDEIQNLNVRRYAIRFHEGEILHVVGTNGAEIVVEYEDCDGIWIYETDKSGYFKVWTTLGTASSEVVEENVDCTPIVLPDASATIMSISAGFVKTYTLSVSNAEVPLRPTIFMDYEFIGINGESITAVDVASGTTLTVTQPGTLTITTNAFGYESKTVTILNDSEYGIKKEWDFARMSEEEIKNVGFPSFLILNSPTTSGFNNWTARKRLWYYQEGSEHDDGDGNIVLDKVYPFGFISEDNEINVLKYSVIDNSGLKEPAGPNAYFEGLTIFPDRGGFSESEGYPNVGMLYHIGLYNDQTRNKNNNVIVHGLEKDEVVVFNIIDNYGGNSKHPVCSNDDEYYSLLQGQDILWYVNENGEWNVDNQSYDVTYPLYRIDTALTKITVLRKVTSALTGIVIGLATPEDLEAVGLSSTMEEIPGGTVIVDNEAASLSLEYTDDWHTRNAYGAYRYVKVGNSEEITLGTGVAGNTNPVFGGYQDGVMSSGAVFELKSKADGWITIFTNMNPNKQYIVFEGRSNPLAYTLGVAGSDYNISYTLPSLESGYIDLNAQDASRYFLDGSKPQYPYLVAGLEFAPTAGTGFIKFKVKQGESYYVSALGSKMACQGFVYTPGETEPDVTLCATDVLPEIKFKGGSTPTVTPPEEPSLGNPIVSGSSTIVLATQEDLEMAGITGTKTEIPGGTMVLNTDVGSFSLAYDDEWGRISTYRSYRNVKIGDSEEINLGLGAVGNTNPTFVSYQEGVMSAGAVFKMKAKKDGWMTVFSNMNPNKQYIVFEGETGALPYTLGIAGDGDMAGEAYKINYTLPYYTSGDNEGMIDFYAEDADKYFREAEKQSVNESGLPLWYDENGGVVAGERPSWLIIDEYGDVVGEQKGSAVMEPILGEYKPQMPWIVAGMEKAPGIGTGFMTFRVKAGKDYYVSGLGTKMSCQGFILTESVNAPAVTFSATEELPEIKFNTTLSHVTLEAGDDFEYQGIWYTVINTETKTCKTKAGAWNNGDTYAGNNFTGDLIIPSIASDGQNEYTVVEIGDYSFWNNTEMTSVSIPESIEYVGNSAFEECIGLKDASFVSLESLCSINFSSYRSNPLSYVKRLCFDGKEITELVIPESISEIKGYTFSDCRNIVSVVLHEGITSIGSMAFHACLALSSIEFPKSLESIGVLAFQDCVSLKSVSMPEGLSKIDECAFRICGNLTEITLPASLTYIGNGAFEYCHALSKVTYYANIPIIASEGVFKSDADVIYENTILNAPNATFADIQAPMPWNKFQHITAKDGAYGFLQVGDDFEYQGIWYTVVNADTKTCKTKEGDYNNGDKIAGNKVDGDIVIPSVAYNGYVGYSVVEIGRYSFCKNTELTSVSIPESVNAIETDAFDDCSNLAKANFASIESLCNINFRSSSSNPLYLSHHLYIGNEEVTELVIPESVTSIKFCTFTGGSNLRSVEFHEGLTAIGSSAFSGCSQLTNVELPSSLISIESDAFANCSSLYSINFPEGIQTIGNQTFVYCGSLTSITIPAGITSIGRFAFYECTALSTVTYYAVTPIVGNNNIFSSYDGEIYSNATLNMPNATLADIQSTTPWDQFKHIIAKDGSIGIVSVGDDFEYNGIWYTVLGKGRSLIGKADGSMECDNLLSGRGGTGFETCKIVSDADRGNVFMCEILPDRENPWDCEFFLKSNEPLQAGDRFTVSFMYKCTDERSIQTYAFGEPGSYHHWKCIGTLNATPDWQRYSWSGIVEPEWVGDEGFKSIDFLLSSAPYAATFYVDDVVFELDRNACKTKDDGNTYSGDLVIPNQVSYESNEYIVVEVGEQGFSGSSHLTSISVPSTIESIGKNAFSGCERLTSLEWRGKQQMPDGVVEAIANPNLLVYVEDTQYAPEILDHNVVSDGICEHLVLTPDYPFTPVSDFTAKSSSFTKDFLQTTPVDGCAGWETIVLPFDVTRVVGPDGKAVTAFDAVTDVSRQRPYWLYEADSTGEWKSASAINAGVPYIISMPNNPRYNPAYNIHGAVTFSNPNPQLIATSTTAPYATTWASGSEFRSLWLPLDDSEKATAMGLNVGIDNLTDDDGVFLAPGSAFHSGVLPKPLEAYVVSNGNTKAFRIWGSQSAVLMLPDEDGLKISQDGGILTLQSSGDRVVEIFSADGTLLRRIELKADFPVYIEGLPQGVCLIAGRKVIIR